VNPESLDWTQRVDRAHNRRVRKVAVVVGLTALLVAGCGSAPTALGPPTTVATYSLSPSPTGRQQICFPDIEKCPGGIYASPSFHPPSSGHLSPPPPIASQSGHGYTGDKAGAYDVAWQVCSLVGLGVETAKQFVNELGLKGVYIDGEINLLLVATAYADQNAVDWAHQAALDGCYDGLKNLLDQP
jgi:hypothetical protein